MFKVVICPDAAWANGVAVRRAKRKKRCLRNGIKFEKVDCLVENRTVGWVRNDDIQNADIRI